MPLLVVGVICAGAFFLSFPYWVSTRFCMSDSSALEQHIGEYADEVFLSTLRDTKSVPNAIRAWTLGRERPVAISVSSDTITAFDTWQARGTSVDCAYALRNEVSLEGRSERYVRMDDRNDGPYHRAPYFNVLFAGCYRDQQNEPWCFRPNEIQIGQATHHGELLLDLTALPQENVVRLNNGNSLLVFRHTPGGKWSVNESDETSKDKALDWVNPWRVLTPAPAETQ